MTRKGPAFWNPCLDSSDGESEESEKDEKNDEAKVDGNSDLNTPENSDIEGAAGGKRKKSKNADSGKSKRHRKRGNSCEEEESDFNPDEEAGSETEESDKPKPKKSDKSGKSRTKKRTKNEKSSKKKKRKLESGQSDSDYNPDETDDEEEGEEGDFSDDNISDSDYIPDSEEEKPDDPTDPSFVPGMDDSAPKKGINKGASKDNKNTYDPNTKEFWSKVEELRNKGFSVQQTQLKPGQAKPGPASAANKELPKFKNGNAAGSPGAAFNYLYIHFEHEKRCMRKCFMMEGKQRQALMELKDPTSINPDFIKACIRVVMCCMRLGDTATARDAITLLNKLGETVGISALCQAMISGVKVQSQSLNEIDQLEKEGMDALRNKEFTKALEILEKALKHASGCLRLQMARGDCLAHLGRYVDGARAASGILQQDQRNVGALFLRGFCLYHKDNVERAHTHFQQVLQISPDHARAKTLLGKAKMYKDKKEAAAKAMASGRLEDARTLYTEVGEIDPRNKGTNAKILANRAGVLAKMKKFDESIEDCDKALELDSNCLAALLQRAKCYLEQKELEKAVRDFERVQSRDKHNQQSKKKAGDTALKNGNKNEAYRLYNEAVAVDKHNQQYRHLLRKAKTDLAKMTRLDYYSILGIENTCGDSEIKKAYYKKSKEYHPDRHASADEEQKDEFNARFKEVKEAYEVLSDKQKRTNYDTGNDIKLPPGGWYRDIDPKILQTVFPARGGIRGGIAGIRRGVPLPRGVNVTRGPVRGVINRGGITRGVPRGVNIIRGNMVRGANMAGRGVMRGGVTIRGANMRGGIVRGNIVRGAIRPGVRGVVRGMPRPGVPMRGGAPPMRGTIRPGFPQPRPKDPNISSSAQNENWPNRGRNYNLGGGVPRPFFGQKGDVITVDGDERKSNRARVQINSYQEMD